MIALRLVVDTNIVVSAALKPDGLQRTVLLLAVTRPARLYVTHAVLAEYREVLARPEFKIRKGLRQQFVQLLTNRARTWWSPWVSCRLRKIPTTTGLWNVRTLLGPTT